jgi:hypothetical protein
MAVYTPTPARLTTLTIPADAVDQRRAQSVNVPFQALGDDAAQWHIEIDAIATALALLPGSGANYTTQITIPATAGTGQDTYWNNNTYNGYGTAMVQQTVDPVVLSIPLVGLPKIGKIARYEILLHGHDGVTAGHTVMPVVPVHSTLIRSAQTGGTVIGTTQEPADQTVGVYDSMHRQESAIASPYHTIDFGTTYPASYHVCVYGESGTHSIPKAAIYSVKVFLVGLSVT